MLAKFSNGSPVADEFNDIYIRPMTHNMLNPSSAHVGIWLVKQLQSDMG